MLKSGQIKTMKDCQSRQSAKILLLRAGLFSRGNAQAGLSLLEVLVAIILITVIVSIITPPIFFAVATRVNNRRTEQALQLAQAEIERVRLLMTSTDTQAEIANLLPEAAAVAPGAIASVPAPTALCDDLPPCGVGELASAEPQLDADKQRFYIQSFRDTGAVTSDGDVLAFRMGVRVYSSDVDDNLGSLDAETKPLFTTGTGYRGSSPLAVMYTELNRGGARQGTLNELREYTN